RPGEPGVGRCCHEVVERERVVVVDRLGQFGVAVLGQELACGGGNVLVQQRVVGDAHCADAGSDVGADDAALVGGVSGRGVDIADHVPALAEHDQCGGHAADGGGLGELCGFRLV